MCCFMGRAQVIHAEHGTQILSGLVDHPEHGRIAVMYYRNTVASLGPNAMLMPIRAEGWIETQNILDLRGGSDPLWAASRQIWPPPAMRGGYGSRPIRYGEPIGAAAHRVTVEHVGDYSVVVANQARLIPEALSEVPKDRRPSVNKDVLKFMEEHYAADGFKILLACWNGQQLSASLGLWYHPELDIEGYLRVPAFDYHSEDDTLAFGVPVTVDHELMFGTPEMTDGLLIDWSGVKKDLLPFLPQRMAGSKQNGLKPNGDFGIKIEPDIAYESILVDSSVVRLSADHIIRNTVTA